MSTISSRMTSHEIAIEKFDQLDDQVGRCTGYIIHISILINILQVAVKQYSCTVLYLSHRITCH